MKNSKGKVYQYCLDGNFIKEFDNTLDAEFQLKISNHSISSVLSGRIRHTHGYIFSRTYYLKYPINNSIKKPNKLMLDFNVVIYSYDCNGNFLEKYNSLKEVSKRKDIRNWIRACLKGENKTYDNRIWLFEYYDILPEELLNKILDKRIFHIDINGKLIDVYINSSDASRKTGLSRSSISFVANGKRNSLFGDRFLKYKEYKRLWQHLN